MMPLRMISVLLIFAPLIGAAQQVASDLAYLRSKAIAEGSVGVTVTTKSATDTAGFKGAMTTEQQPAIGRALHKIMMVLVSRGLVVGNAASIQPDGSLVLRVLPEGLDVLARSPDVTAVRSTADASTVQP